MTIHLMCAWSHWLVVDARLRVFGRLSPDDFILALVGASVLLISDLSRTH